MANEGIKLATIKDWHTPTAHAWVVAACASADGGTHIAPAILAGTRLIAQRDADRRIILILTDGDDSYPPEAARSASTMAMRDHGVEVCAIGLRLGRVTPSRSARDHN